MLSCHIYPEARKRPSTRLRRCDWISLIRVQRVAICAERQSISSGLCKSREEARHEAVRTSFTPPSKLPRNTSNRSCQTAFGLVKGVSACRAEWSRSAFYSQLTRRSHGLGGTATEGLRQE